MDLLRLLLPQIFTVASFQRASTMSQIYFRVAFVFHQITGDEERQKVFLSGALLMDHIQVSQLTSFLEPYCS